MRIQLLKFCVLVGLSFFACHIQAQVTHVVTNVNDAGPNSLRQASIDAVSGDIIRFDPALIGAGNNTLLLTSGEIDFGNKAVTIKGIYNSNDTLFISGNNSSRIFSFNGAGDVTLDSLVLIEANGVGALNSGYGGAVMYRAGLGSLVINQSIFMENSTSYGGAIDFISDNSSSLIINHSTFIRNEASNNGGAVYSDNFPLPVFLSISNSTFFENSALRGGAVYCASFDDYVNVMIGSSTFNKNSASNNGGGIYTYSLGTDISIVNSTMSDNSSINNGGGVYSSGHPSMTVTTKGSIFDRSSFYTVTGITSNGYNAFSDTPPGTLSLGDVTDQNFNLLPLAYNGGATKTMLPGPGSVAINSGDPFDLTNAQNGPILQSGREIGAAEVCYGAKDTAIIACETYSWSRDGNTYTNDTTVNFIIQDAAGAGCDSAYVLELYILTNDISDISTSSNESVLCANNSGTNVNVIASELGVTYTLRDDENDTLIDGPIDGTGGDISLSTGDLSSSMTYNVIAEELPTTLNGMDFLGNGAATRVELPTQMWTDHFEGTTDFTVEAWVNRASNNISQTIVSNYNGTYPFVFRIDSDKIHFFVNSSTNVLGTSTIPVGTWTHVAATYDGEYIKVYVNGVLENSLTFTAPLIASSATMSIGGGINGTSEYFDGKIADVRIWNTPRTVSQISIFKDYEMDGSEAGLIANYKFNEGAGSIAENSVTGNLYPGDVQNNPLWVTGPTLNNVTCGFELSETQTITVLSEKTGSVTSTICYNDSVIVNGTTYNAANSTGTEIFTNVGPYNCDSTVTIALNINNIDMSTTQNGADLSANATGASYQWLDCDNGNTPITGATNQDYTATANGNYAVEVTENGCTDTSACMEVNNVGIDDYKTSFGVKLYPNPATDHMFIKIANMNKGGYLVHVLDLSGKTVLSQVLLSETSEINTSTLVEGVYIVEVSNNEIKEHFRLVKH